MPADLASLSEQARIAVSLKPDLIEWRADFLRNQTSEGLLECASVLRRIAPDTAIIFTLRAKSEGGAQDIPSSTRRLLIDSVLRSKTIDIVDLELANEPSFLAALIPVAKDLRGPRAPGDARLRADARKRCAERPDSCDA